MPTKPMNEPVRSRDGQLLTGAGRQCVKSFMIASTRSSELLNHRDRNRYITNLHKSTHQPNTHSLTSTLLPTRHNRASQSNNVSPNHPYFLQMSMQHQHRENLPTARRTYQETARWTALPNVQGRENSAFECRMSENALSRTTENTLDV